MGDFTKILILCGGKGTRLRPITEEIPKPMVHLKGKPIIEHILYLLSRQGFSEFVIAIGYKGEIIKDYFNRIDNGYKIEFRDAGDCSMMERILDAKDILGDTFLVVYGDTIADVNLKDLLEFHKLNSAGVTITTYKMQSHFGIVESSDDGRVIEFKEKPILDHWINIGFMVFDKVALEQFRKGCNLIEFFNALIKKGKLYEYRHNGKHITVNTEKEKQESEKEVIDFYTTEA